MDARCGGWGSAPVQARGLKPVTAGVESPNPGPFVAGVVVEYRSRPFAPSWLLLGMEALLSSRPSCYVDLVKGDTRLVPPAVAEPSPGRTRLGAVAGAGAAGLESFLGHLRPEGAKDEA